MERKIKLSRSNLFSKAVGDIISAKAKKTDSALLTADSQESSTIEFNLPVAAAQSISNTSLESSFQELKDASAISTDANAKNLTENVELPAVKTDSIKEVAATDDTSDACLTDRLANNEFRSDPKGQFKSDMEKMKVKGRGKRINLETTFIPKQIITSHRISNKKHHQGLPINHNRVSDDGEHCQLPNSSVFIEKIPCNVNNKYGSTASMPPSSSPVVDDSHFHPKESDRSSGLKQASSPSAFEKSPRITKNHHRMSGYKHPNSLPTFAANSLVGMESVRLNENSAFCHSEPYIDSHCHLDLLLWERHRWQHSFSKFQSDVVSSTNPGNFAGCIAVFAHPRYYESEGSYDKVCSLLGEDNIFGSIGCHPKCATSWTENLEATIRRLAETSGEKQKVVALGECGLDYSKNFGSQADVQKQAFISQMNLAVELKLPLVVHCRDAEDDCFKVMTANLPHDHPVHRHCFTGSSTDLKRWLYAFPNMSFGFTPSVLNNNRSINQVLKDIPIDRVLLETDAPYFLPPTVRNVPGLRSCSHPGLAVFVAEHIASVRNVDIEEILRQTYANTSRVYSGAKFENFESRRRADIVSEL